MSWIDATYHVRSTAAAIDGRAQALAVEQSIEMPVAAVRDAWIRDEVLGRVIAVEPLAGDLYRVRIGLAAATVGADAGQLLNMLYGNSSLHDDVTLEDFTLPPETETALGHGPRIGLAGLRRRVDAGRRALTCSALKPQGLPPAGLAELAGAFAQGGIDYIKDDHGLAEQAYSPFMARIAACAAAVRSAVAISGHATRYAPSLSGSLDAVRAQLNLMREEGLDTAVVAPMILGVSNVQLLARDYPDIAFLAHPSLAGAARIAPYCLAKLLRLIGMDGLIFPNHGGRFGYSEQTCLGIADAARAPWAGHAPAVPIPAGGMSIERVPEMLDFYGDDVMLLIGGNLLAEGARLSAATAAFVETVARYSGAKADG